MRFLTFAKLISNNEKNRKVRLLLLKIILKMSRIKGDQEKSSSGKKFESAKKSNFFPFELFSWIFFEFIWKQLDYKNGRPLILKLIPNDEEWTIWIWPIHLIRYRKTFLKFHFEIENWLECTKIWVFWSLQGFEWAVTSTFFFWFCLL